MRVHIGTSGWSYEHWKGIFYPEDLDRSEWLSFYSSSFDTVEVNSTFYRLPFENVVKGWKRKTPEDFKFAVKGWRMITHSKRLKNVEEDLQRFMQRLSGLEGKLAVILWQFPPSLKKDLPLLRDFLGLLPKSVRHSVEFRHGSWLYSEVYQALSDFGIALCISHSKRFEVPWIKTAPFAYVRLHGPEKLYASRYSKNQLEVIARRIEELDVETFVYFNNDFEGYAVENAHELMKALR